MSRGDQLVGDRPQPYEWAVLRVVPRVERGEFVNAGVVLYCKAHGFLAAHVALAEERARALDPHLGLTAVGRHLRAIADVAAGAPTAGANGARPEGDRFRWLTAPRSTVVQPGPVHLGLTAEPAGELERLASLLLGAPTPPP